MEKILKEITCPECNGYGFIIDVRATCCGNLQNGSCCGIPDPEQYQKECYCNNGIILVEEDLNNSFECSLPHLLSKENETDEHLFI